MKFKILCDKGDAGYDYDTDVAEIKFDELKSSGMLPMVITPDKREIVQKFDPDIEEISWLPAVMGG